VYGLLENVVGALQVIVVAEGVVGAVDRDMVACAARLKVEVRFRALASAAPRPAAYHLHLLSTPLPSTLATIVYQCDTNTSSMKLPQLHLTCAHRLL
jgi:hypothetical protein